MVGLPTTVLEGTVLEGTVLEGTVLVGTVLVGTVLVGTVLVRAVLAGAVLVGTVLVVVVRDDEASDFALSVEEGLPCVAAVVDVVFDLGTFFFVADVVEVAVVLLVVFSVGLIDFFWVLEAILEG